MNPSAKRGNSPERWEKLLQCLDDKLQLGLLEHLRRVAAYHFEEDTLYLEPGDPNDERYLAREEVLQHLKLLAEDAVKIERVKLKKLSD